MFVKNEGFLKNGKVPKEVKTLLKEAYSTGGFLTLIEKTIEMLGRYSMPCWRLMNQSIKTLPVPDMETINKFLALELPPSIKEVARDFWPRYEEKVFWSGLIEDQEYASIEEARVAEPETPWFHKTTLWFVREGPWLNVSCKGICVDTNCRCNGSTWYYDDSHRYREEYDL